MRRRASEALVRRLEDWQSGGRVRGRRRPKNY